MLNKAFQQFRPIPSSLGEGIEVTKEQQQQAIRELAAERRELIAAERKAGR